MKSFLKSTAGAVGGGLMAAGAITGGAVAAVTGLTPLIAGAVGIGAGAKKGAAWGKSVFAKTEDVDKSIEETAKVTEKESPRRSNKTQRDACCVDARQKSITCSSRRKERYVQMDGVVATCWTIRCIGSI